MDFNIRLDKLPSLGETVLGKGFFICGGGKGANQAACIAKLGSEVNFISNIGIDYFGKKTLENLNRAGINTKFVKKDKQHHSGAAFILVDKHGRNMIAVSSGSNMFLTPSDILKRADAIKKSDILLVQLEIPIKTVKAALSLAKRYGSLTILNPAPAKRLTKDILSKVDILVPNEVELKMLGGENLLLKSGVGCVIITRGKKGALLINRQGVKSFKAKKVKVVDTTCAGDAFCGALALGLDRGKTIEEAIEFANCAAALTTTKLGAQSSLPTKAELKKFFCSFLSRGRAAW